MGETPEQRRLALEVTVAELPLDKVRYVMGLGDPVGVLEAVALGADLFDCVWPTRLARHGKILTPTATITSRRPDSPPTRARSSGCGCSTCRVHSRAYLRHLHVTGELLAHSLLTVHNLHYTMQLMAARVVPSNSAGSKSTRRFGGQATFAAPTRRVTSHPARRCVGRTHVTQPRRLRRCGYRPRERRRHDDLGAGSRDGKLPLGLILPLVLFVGIFYFLILRPQRQRMKQQQELMANIGLGDEVRTIGGIVGRIVSMDDENVVLEVEEGRIKFSRAP